MPRFNHNNVPFVSSDDFAETARFVKCCATVLVCIVFAYLAYLVVTAGVPTFVAAFAIGLAVVLDVFVVIMALGCNSKK